MEKTKFYKLLWQGTAESLKEAHKHIDKMSMEEVCLRQDGTRMSWYHALTNMAAKVHKNCGSLNPLFPIIYKLALKDINVNAQNDTGNTCLHLACLKPKTEELCEHFIRVGLDPCIMNHKGCRVIHTMRNHECKIVKGQAQAKSGIWNAVEKEDIELTRRLLKSWVRVNATRNKSLHAICDETSNQHIRKLLDDYEITNEFMINALAGNVTPVKEMLKAGHVNLSCRDASRDIPRPIINVVMEFGEVCAEVVEVLKDHGMDPSEYEEKMLARETAFENEEFYHKVEEETEDSLREALNMVADLDVTLTSNRIETLGWNYLHYIIHKYNQIDKTEKAEQARGLIRILYRLALKGADINARNTKGETPLIKAAEYLDQELMTHVIRLGGSSYQTALDGSAVHMEVYEDKGKLVFNKYYRTADLPGLTVAVKTDDEKKAQRWLKKWARVTVKRGDRRLLDEARDLGHTKIAKLMDSYIHINEFVCATFACDLEASLNLLSLGKGAHKVNTIDEFFHVGYTWDRHAEFMSRPIIVAALEICNHEVVEFLLKYGADLSRQYEECFPCGPVMFHAFRDHVDGRNSLVVAQHADVNLQDETGCTMLHKAIRRKSSLCKKEIVQVLLDREINIAARDWEGSTARDYIDIFDIENADEIRRLIDQHLFGLINKDMPESIENLIVESYDHVMDIRSEKRNKSLLDIAMSKEYKEIERLLRDYDQYKERIDSLHNAAKSGDIVPISKYSAEGRCALSKDISGRTLLHNAVLYGHADIVKFLVEQYPNLVNSTDNMLRTPLHYCVCLDNRQAIWPTLQDAGADPNLIDANGLSVYDYTRELDAPTDVREKPRGRRQRDYRPDKLINHERQFVPGIKAKRYRIRANLRKLLRENASLADIKKVTSELDEPLSTDDIHVELIQMSIKANRAEVVKHFLENCGAKHDVMVKVRSHEEAEDAELPLVEAAERLQMEDLVELLRTKMSQEAS